MVRFNGVGTRLAAVLAVTLAVSSISPEHVGAQPRVPMAGTPTAGTIALQDGYYYTGSGITTSAIALGAGWDPGATITLMECAHVRLSDQGCAGPVSVIADGTGAFAQSMTLSDPLTALSGTVSNCRLSRSYCELVAFDARNRTLTATKVPIVFLNNKVGIKTFYSPTESARLTAGAALLHVSNTRFQHDTTMALAYAYALNPPGVLASYGNTGSVRLGTTYTGAIGVFVMNTAQDVGMTPPQFQKFAVLNRLTALGV